MYENKMLIVNHIRIFTITIMQKTGHYEWL